MEAYDINNLYNGFYRLDYFEVTFLQKHGFQWTNSLNISAFKYKDNDVIIRLHNGSLYLFEGQADWGRKNLFGTIRKDVIGILIRKKTPYYFVGVLSMKDDIDASDNELLFLYLDDVQKEKTRKVDVYKNDYRIEEITFYGPNDTSIVNYRFQLVCAYKDAVYSLGQIYIEEIIDADWAKWNKLKIHLYDDTYHAIKFMRRCFGEKVEIMFVKPEKGPYKKEKI